MSARIISIAALLWLAVVNVCFFWTRINHSSAVAHLLERIGVK